MNIKKHSQINNFNFTGKHIIKLSSEQVRKANSLEASYDTLTTRVNKLNGPYRTIFKSFFPGLCTGGKTKGYQLFTNDYPNISQFHIYKFSLKSPLTLRVFDGEKREFQFSCALNKNTDSLDINTSEAFDEKIKNTKENLIDNIKEYMNNLIKEFDLLLDYSEFFIKIKNKLSSTSTKKEIAELIYIEKSKLETSTSLQKPSTKLPMLFKDIKEKLNHKKSALQIKKAFYKERQIIEEKGLRFYKNNETSITYTPLQSAEDDRIYRLQSFDSDNNLKNTFIAFNDGSFATLKNSEKPNDIRKNNLIKLTEEELDVFDVKKELLFINDKFLEFLDFIEDFINKHKFAVINGKYEIRDANEFIAEKENKKLLKIQEKLALKNKIKEEKKALKQQAKEEEIKKKNELKAKIKQEKELAKRKEKLQKQPSLFTKEIINEYLLDMNKVFSTPVEKRSKRFSHERLSNSKLFSGKFFVTLPDKTQISVTHIKSSRYEDFEYYSIRVQKDNEFCIMNLDTTNGGIISSTEEGKPILQGKRIKYTPASEFAKQNTLAQYMPYYLETLFHGDVEKGKIINSTISIHKRLTPDEILNAELPILDNYQP